jgi:hypothetical protein
MADFVDNPCGHVYADGSKWLLPQHLEKIIRAHGRPQLLGPAFIEYLSRRLCNFCSVLDFDNIVQWNGKDIIVNCFRFTGSRNADVQPTYTNNC